MINFKNKNIIITGATGGIGGSLVKKFISLNGNVLGTGTKAEKLNLLERENSGLKVKKFDISNHLFFSSTFIPIFFAVAIAKLAFTLSKY